MEPTQGLSCITTTGTTTHAKCSCAWRKPGVGAALPDAPRRGTGADLPGHTDPRAAHARRRAWLRAAAYPGARPPWSITPECSGQINTKNRCGPPAPHPAQGESFWVSHATQPKSLDSGTPSALQSRRSGERQENRFHVSPGCIGLGPPRRLGRAAPCRLPAGLRTPTRRPVVLVCPATFRQPP